ncbi:MAG: 7,8-didemethyl-8-hydroxy-5-deazariboflavin synthase subunit CofH, partial [bacterium]
HPRKDYSFEHKPESSSSFEDALRKARKGDRLTVDDGVELITTGTDQEGIDRQRKQRVIELADERRRQMVGDDVTFVANLNNNLTTACNTGCLFCNFKDPAHQFEEDAPVRDDGFTKTPEESREIVRDHVESGIYEVCSVSGLHPALVLDEEHRDILENMTDPPNYKPREQYEKDPGTYVTQMKAMKVDGVHLHSMTPEEAYHALRGTAWDYEYVYERLAEVGLDTVPGTAAEILVEEVRDVICPNKISTSEWMEAMEAAANVGLPITSTIMYGHVENERHRVMHLERIRTLQDRTEAITEFVPLKFIYPDTPLHERDMVDGTSSRDEDELLMATSRLFLDNVENIQSSWVKYGDELGLDMLNYGANDFMGTLLSEEITKRAGGDHGVFRSFQDYVEMIASIDRNPVERSTDYSSFRPVSNGNFGTPGPKLGPHADGTPLLS